MTVLPDSRHPSGHGNFLRMLLCLVATTPMKITAGEEFLGQLAQMPRTPAERRASCRIEQPPLPIAAALARSRLHSQPVNAAFLQHRTQPAASVSHGRRTWPVSSLGLILPPSASLVRGSSPAPTRLRRQERPRCTNSCAGRRPEMPYRVCPH